jgi:dienelactone hydrolase
VILPDALLNDRLPSQLFGILLLSLVGVGPLWSQPLTTRPHEILDESRSHAALRATLLAYADSVSESERGNASDAYGYAGESYLRHALLDSAIIRFEQAYAVQRGPDQAVALIDALLMREDRDDADRARAMLRDHLASIPRGRFDRREFEAREMWMLHLEGHADSAAVALEQLMRDFEFDDLWRYRAGLVATAIPDPEMAARFLIPLAEVSRTRDDAVMEAVVAAVALLGHDANSAVGALQRSVGVRDETLAEAVHAFRGRTVRFQASDGFDLGGAFFRPEGRSRRAAILLMGAGDTLSVYDSLVTQLRREGFAVLVFARRGEAFSADESCALPSAWRGREAELEDRVAFDFQDALRMLASLHPVDTTRYVAGGIGRSAGIAMRAAELDPRVRAIILASAEPPQVNRGVVLGRAERLQRPTFLQVAPEDLVDLYYYTDALYQAGEHKYSRVSESKAQGRGAEQFRHDSRNNSRLRLWLQSVKPLLDAD